jgi:hypothetical protein
MCHGSTTRIITKLVRIMEATTCIIEEENVTTFPSSYFVLKIEPFSVKIDKVAATSKKKNPLSSKQ